MISDDAAYAANWRTVLAVDAVLGLAVVVGGAVLGVRSMPIVGSLLVVAGAAYLILIARRYLRWRALRRAAGLD